MEVTVECNQCKKRGISSRITVDSIALLSGARLRCPRCKGVIQLPQTRDEVVPKKQLSRA
ncbi:MAG: hypothetical protein CENE_01186 [Candidatus Celerinatantimonas neptuna]|nr:MAG: hypothetical protein CENE_01186 [Candidatus Celerinatantimonas neptuna]